MINYKTGNILTYRFEIDTRPTLLIHCCNDCDRFGAGFAAAVASKYPQVKKEYHQWYETTSYCCDITDDEVPFKLGQVQFIKVKPNLYFGNMLGQAEPGGSTFRIGEKIVKLRPLRLDSLRECLYNVAVVAKKLNAHVMGPMFGSNLAGGDWQQEIVPIINECLCNFSIPVTIFKLS